MLSEQSVCDNNDGAIVSHSGPASVILGDGFDSARPWSHRALGRRRACAGPLRSWI
jgi:hypothetical protein